MKEPPHPTPQGCESTVIAFITLVLQRTQGTGKECSSHSGLMVSRLVSDPGLPLPLRLDIGRLTCTCVCLYMNDYDANGLGLLREMSVL